MAFKRRSKRRVRLNYAVIFEDMSAEEIVKALGWPKPPRGMWSARLPDGSLLDYSGKIDPPSAHHWNNAPDKHGPDHHEE